jgi:hypothetical protein
MTTTPLGFPLPDGNERVKDGDNVLRTISQTAQDLIAELQTRFPSHFDGGTPSTVYAAEQLLDGGTV